MLSTGGSRKDSPVNKPLNPQIKECYGIFEKARRFFKIFCTLYPWISSRIIDHLRSSLKHLKEWFILYPDITFSALRHRQYLDIFLLIHNFLLAGNKTIHQKLFWNLGVDSNVAKFGLTECKWLKIEKKNIVLWGITRHFNPITCESLRNKGPCLSRCLSKEVWLVYLEYVLGWWANVWLAILDRLGYGQSVCLWGQPGR